MPEAHDQFDGRWFRRRFHWRSPYHRFAEAILEVFEPEGVADVGCGMGWLLECLAPRLPCIGVEGSLAAVRLMPPEVRRLVHVHDLRTPPIPQMADYEFCVSIEVAEHIEAEFAETFLDWVTQGARLLLTAAPPGQRGLHHVNCRPPEYWIERLVPPVRDWRHEPDRTEQWRAAVLRRTTGCPWVVRNAMYFERRRPEGLTR